MTPVTKPYSHDVQSNGTPIVPASDDATYGVVPVANKDGTTIGSAFGALQAVDQSGVESDNVGVAPFRRSDAFQTVPTDTQANTVQSVKAAIALKTIYVTDIIISWDGGLAANIIIQDDAGTPIKLEKIFIPATAGSIHFRYNTPKKCTLGQALNYICSSATPHISVSAAGYVI